MDLLNVLTDVNGLEAVKQHNPGCWSLPSNLFWESPCSPFWTPGLLGRLRVFLSQHLTLLYEHRTYGYMLPSLAFTQSSLNFVPHSYTTNTWPMAPPLQSSSAYFLTYPELAQECCLLLSVTYLWLYATSLEYNFPSLRVCLWVSY